MTDEQSTDRAKHFSQGKSAVDQLPVEILFEWADIFAYGEKKYGRDNWKSGLDYHEFYGSLLRHIFKFWNGEDYDNCDNSEGCAGSEADFCPKHSRLHHLAHAIWNAACLRYYQIHDLGIDDR